MTNKEKIQQAARELFYRKGYIGTSVDDVATAAGVSKSNFYYHFSTKEDLAIAVLDQRRDDLHAVLAASLGDASLDPMGRLTLFLDRIVGPEDASYGSAGCPFGNLAVEAADHNERFRCYLSALFGSLIDRIAAVVREGQEVGQLRDDIDAHDLASVMLHTIQGMHVIAKCHKCAGALRSGAQSVLTLMATAAR